MGKLSTSTDGGLEPRPGIFCLEGEWSDDLQQRMSVRPVLQLLEQVGLADTIHRDVATIGDFEYYVKKWQDERYTNFKVLYLAMHGGENGICLSEDLDSGEIALEELAAILAGACKGKVLYFGSCLTMKVEPKILQDFVRRTGARAVIGYRRPVEWMKAAAFEVFLLEQLVSGLRSDAVFNRLVKEHASLAKTLGLVVATRSQVRRVALRQSTGRTSV